MLSIRIRFALYNTFWFYVYCYLSVELFTFCMQKIKTIIWIHYSKPAKQ